MDRETLSHYGWIVILVLILAVLLALATPFGSFIAEGFKATYAGFGMVSDNALGVAIPGAETHEPNTLYYYQPYVFGFGSGQTAEVVFHKDGAYDIYYNDNGSEWGEIYTDDDSAIYENGTVEFIGGLYDISEDGTQLLFEGNVAATMVPTQIHSLYMNTDYIKTDGEWEYVLSFKADGSASYKEYCNGEENYSWDMSAGEFKYFDEHFEEHYYDDYDGQTYIDRHAVYPDGTKIINYGNVYVLACTHPETEIRNKTDNYTGDTYCKVCNKLIERGKFVGDELFGLYEDGAIEIYNQYGIEAVADMQIMSWSEMVNNNILTVNGGILDHNCEWIDPNPKSRAVAINNDLTGDLIIHPDSNIHTIADGAFASCGNLTGIVLPDTVTTIGERAFSYAVSLDNINITNNIKNIGKYAFECINVKEFIWPSSVTVIPQDVFSSAKLEYILIPNTVTEIQSKAFEWSDLKTIEFEANSSLQTIGEYAFKYTNIESINLPRTVTNIESYAFQKCLDLTKVVINSSELTMGYSIFEEQLTSMGGLGSGMMVECNSDVFFIVLKGLPGNCLETLKIPENTEEAFHQMLFISQRKLKELHIPNDVKLFGMGTFAFQRNLSTVYFNGTIEKWETIQKDTSWKNDSLFTQVICTNGRVNV